MQDCIPAALEELGSTLIWFLSWSVSKHMRFTALCVWSTLASQKQGIFSIQRLQVPDIRWIFCFWKLLKKWGEVLQRRRPYPAPPSVSLSCCRLHLSSLTTCSLLLTIYLLILFPIKRLKQVGSILAIAWMSLKTGIHAMLGHCLVLQTLLVPFRRVCNVNPKKLRAARDGSLYNSKGIPSHEAKRFWSLM